MRSIDIIMIRLGALYLMAAFISILMSSISHISAFAAAHTHMVMIGFGLHSIFGIIYRQWPDLKTTRFARIHGLLFIAGAPILIIGLALPNAPEINNATLFGTLLVLLGCLAFTLNLFGVHETGPAS